MKHSTGPDTSPQHYESSFFTRCLKQCADVVVLNPHTPHDLPILDMKVRQSTHCGDRL